MFAVLNVTHWEKSLKGRFNEYFSAPYIDIKEAALPKGGVFYKVEVKPHKGKIPFSELQRIRFPFILPEEFIGEAENYLKLYEVGDFKFKLLFNSALKYIKEENLNPYDCHVMVIDEKAVIKDEIKMLSDFSADITVITKEQEKYKRVGERLMDEKGASLFISEELSPSALKSRFLITADAEKIPLNYGGTAFSLEKKPLLKGRVLTPGGLTLPLEYALLWDKKINKLLFASALHEKAGIKELGALCFDEMCF